VRILIYILITVALFAADPAGFIGQTLFVKAGQIFMKGDLSASSPTSLNLSGYSGNEKHVPLIVDKPLLAVTDPIEQVPAVAMPIPENLADKLDQLLRTIDEESTGGKS